MDYRDFIAKRITELRLKKDISSRALSLDLGLSNSYITQIENKDKLPSLEGLVKICDYFQISLADFFNTDDIGISNDLKNLLDNASHLTPVQIKQLNEFIKTML